MDTTRGVGRGGWRAVAAARPGAVGVAAGTAVLAAAAGILALAAAGAAQPQARQGPAVLIVADEWKPMDALAEFLRAEGGCRVQGVDQKDLPADLASFHAVIQYIHGAMTPATEKALVAYATGGGRLIALHHAVASARVRNPEWLRLMGIHIAPRDDPKWPWRVLGETTHTLVNLRPGHYITSHKVRYDQEVEYTPSDAPSAPQKCPAIDLPNTEAFLNQQFTDGREKTVLFGFRAADPKTGEVFMQDRAGWYKPAGKGWVFYLQPGHAEADFRNRAYAQIVLNCLAWDPAAGA